MLSVYQGVYLMTLSAMCLPILELDGFRKGQGNIDLTHLSSFAIQMVEK